MIEGLTDKNVCAKVFDELIACMINLRERVVPSAVTTGARDYSILGTSKCQATIYSIPRRQGRH